MRKSKAKQDIVDCARKLIEKKGYFDLNVNKIAHDAEVSVGTLYYHFPNGKIDILAEIMSQKTEALVEVFNQELRGELVQKGLGLEDTLRWLFKKIIELRRPDRHFLAAIQSEMLASPDDYLELVRKYQTTDGLQQAMGVLAEMMKVSGSKLTVSPGAMESVQRAVGLLMTYQIIFPDYFGSDNEFVELALGTFLSAMKS
jgi:AcrR family transcriptional regulator